MKKLALIILVHLSILFLGWLALGKIFTVVTIKIDPMDLFWSFYTIQACAEALYLFLALASGIPYINYFLNKS